MEKQGWQALTKECKDQEHVNRRGLLVICASAREAVARLAAPTALAVACSPAALLGTGGSHGDTEW